MIHGKSKSPKSLLDVLEASNFTFYPTGSRYFGTQSLSSDYDFFVERDAQGAYYPSPLITFLTQSSFRLEYLSPYKDENTCDLYRAWDSKLNAQIDIQIVKDAPLKQRIQEEIKRLGSNLIPKDKLHAQIFWDLCFKLAKVGDKKASLFTESPSAVAPEPWFDLPPQTQKDVDYLLSQGDKIKAIKRVREVVSTLQEAVTIVGWRQKNYFKL